MSENDHGPFLNTDRELWREPPGDYYANSVHVTENGKLGINVGGMVFVKSLRHWHELAKDAAAAEERGRRSRDDLLREALSVLILWPSDAPFGRAHAQDVCKRIHAALAPRDSGKEQP